MSDWRADLEVQFTNLTRVVLDVGTTNAVSGTALRNSVITHMEGVEEFHAFIISLAGGVTERSWSVLKRLAGIASSCSQPRFEWERSLWAVRMLRRIVAGTAKVIAWELNSLPPRYPGHGRHSADGQRRWPRGVHPA